MGKRGMKMMMLVVTAMLVVTGCMETSSKFEAGNHIKVRYAKHFSLQKREHYVILKILQPDTGKDEAVYALVKPEEKKFVPKGMKVLEIPVRNMTVLSSTHIGMLDAIQQLSCIKGCCSADFIANKTVLGNIRSGKIMDFNDEASVSPEALLKSRSSLVMYSGFGKAFPQQDKLEKLGILAMANYDWREEHPLGKAEWIRLFGYLTDHVDKADAYFAKVEKEYNALRKQLKKSRIKQKVLVGSLIGDVWYAPAGSSYMGHILADAGADYVYASSKGTGSYERTFESVFKDQQDVSIWINAGALSLNDLKRQQPKYALFTSYKHGKVYCYTHNSNFFWEMSAVNPQWLLRDFAMICGTEKGKSLHFYQQLKP